MRIRKLLRVRFVVYSFTEQEKIMAELTPMMQKYMETKEQYKMRDADKSQADPWVFLLRFKALKSDFGLKVLTEA